MGNHYFVNSQAGYEDNSRPYGSYNPQRAEQLLDEAGWVADGDVRKKGGKTLSLRIVILAGLPVSRQEAEIAGTTLAKVGIKPLIVVVPLDVFFDDDVVPGNFDLAPFAYSGTPFPIHRRADLRQAGDGQKRRDRPRAEPLADRHRRDRRADGQGDRHARRRARAGNHKRRRQARLGGGPLAAAVPGAADLGVNAKLANVGAFGFQTPVYEDMGFLK